MIQRVLVLWMRTVIGQTDGVNRFVIANGDFYDSIARLNRGKYYDIRRNCTGQNAP